MNKMLLVFAHPDDESFAAGGTAAKYSKAGWEIDLLCATRGEAGSSGSHKGVHGTALGDIRQKELESAATLLGLHAITFLGYKDGTLAELNPGEMEDKVYQKLMEFRPDIIITFDPTGISNHPDHIKMSLSTTFAFQKYAQDLLPLSQGGQRDRWNIKKMRNRTMTETETAIEPKLYYACMPESTAQYLKKQKLLPAESFGKPWNGTPDKFITTVIDIKRFSTVKTNALLEHKTQQDDVGRYLSFEKNPELTQEHFVLRMQGTYEVFMGKNDRVSNRL